MRRLFVCLLKAYSLPPGQAGSRVIKTSTPLTELVKNREKSPDVRLVCLFIEGL